MERTPKFLRLRRSDHEAILIAAKARLPHEACGLIAGEIQDDVPVIGKVYILENQDHSSEHFSMDPKEQLDAVLDMRRNGMSPLGNWHSHPNTPARPSEEDKRLAFDKNAIYMILSLAEEDPVLHAFHIEGSEASKIEIEIID